MDSMVVVVWVKLIVAVLVVAEVEVSLQLVVGDVNWGYREYIYYSRTRVGSSS